MDGRRALALFLFIFVLRSAITMSRTKKPLRAIKMLQNAVDTTDHEVLVPLGNTHLNIVAVERNYHATIDLNKRAANPVRRSRTSQNCELFFR